MFFGQVREKEILPCLLCAKRYSVEDVKQGKYFVQTRICFDCYKVMESQSFSQSCFGKMTIVNQGVTQYGYNPKALVCAKLCPDRTVCRRFVYPQ